MELHHWLVGVMATAAVLVCSCGGGQAPVTAGATLEGLIEQYLSHRWEASPISATEAGVAGYEDKLPDLSLEAIDRRVARERELLEALRALDLTQLSLEQQVDHQLLVGVLETSIREAERRRPWEANPSLYVPFQAIAGLMGKQAMSVDARARGLTARLQAASRLLAQGRQNLKNPPKSYTEAAVFQTAGLIRFLKEDLPGFADQAGQAKDALLGASTTAIAALEDFRIFLQTDLLPRSTGTWVYGREDYEYFLRHRWYMNTSTDEIRAIGEQAFAETEKLAQEVAERIQPGKHWSEVYERLKDDHPPADQIRQSYQVQIDAAHQYVKDHEIVTLPPDERVVTMDTPPAMRRSSPFGTFDGVGPFEKRLVGTLYITPIEDTLTPEQRQERVRSHHTAWIPIIAVHEAYPGHHVQALKTNENPRVLRRIIHESIFGEGWGLFCEELMWEQGFLRGDDVRLTQLRNRLWRAARVIIDVGIHTGTMSFDQGVDFLVDKVRFERYAAELEVGMYTRSPTMVLGYLIGMKEIQDIRDQFDAKFGKPAKPKDFYDRLLRIGAIPPVLVRKELFGQAGAAIP